MEIQGGKWSERESEREGDIRANGNRIDKAIAMVPPPFVCVDVAWKWYWDLKLGLESKLSRLSRHVVETNKAGKLAKCV